MTNAEAIDRVCRAAELSANGHKDALLILKAVARVRTMLGCESSDEKRLAAAVDRAERMEAEWDAQRPKSTP